MLAQLLAAAPRGAAGSTGSGPQTLEELPWGWGVLLGSVLLGAAVGLAVLALALRWAPLGMVLAPLRQQAAPDFP